MSYTFSGEAYDNALWCDEFKQALGRRGYMITRRELYEVSELYVRRLAPEEAVDLWLDSK